MPRLLPCLAVASLVLWAGARPAAADHAWVASTSIRVIDLDRGDVVGRLTVAEDQVVREIRFDADGEHGFVASMGGLFRVETASLTVQQQLSERPTASVDTAREADRLVALHLESAGEGLTDRQRGIPSTVTLQVYERSSGTPLGAVEVHGSPLWVRFVPDGSRALVLDSKESRLSVFRVPAGAGDLVPDGEVDLAPDLPDTSPVMCTDLELSPDGDEALVLRNGGDGASLIRILAGEATADAPLRIEDLGSGHRARSVAYAADGETILVASLGRLARVTRDDPTPEWRSLGHEYSLVAVSPDGRFVVLATPTFDPERGSGGLLVADPQGRPLRVIELADISPYTVSIQP